MLCFQQFLLFAYSVRFPTLIFIVILTEATCTSLWKVLYGVPNGYHSAYYSCGSTVFLLEMRWRVLRMWLFSIPSYDLLDGMRLSVTEHASRIRCLDSALKCAYCPALSSAPSSSTWGLGSWRKFRTECLCHLTVMFYRLIETLHGAHQGVPSVDHVL